MKKPVKDPALTIPTKLRLRDRASLSMIHPKMLLYGNTRVLIAEDEEMFRTLLARYCQIWGYSLVATCSNGREAILQAVRLQPDLALIDIDMPVFNGLEVVSAVRKKVPGIRLVMVTAEANARNVRTARRYEVDGILDKTTDTFDRIGEVIPEILAGRRYFSPSVAKILAEDSEDLVSAEEVS